MYTTVISIVVTQYFMCTTKIEKASANTRHTQTDGLLERQIDTHMQRAHARRSASPFLSATPQLLFGSAVSVSHHLIPACFPVTVHNVSSTLCPMPHVLKHTACFPVSAHNVRSTLDSTPHALKTTACLPARLHDVSSTPYATLRALKSTASFLVRLHYEILTLHTTSRALQSIARSSHRRSLQKHNASCSVTCSQ